MTHPDNFSAAAFRRAHGGEAYDRADANARAIAIIDSYRAERLKGSIAIWIGYLEAMQFCTIFPAAGYEMEDLLGMMRDIRDKIDLEAYAKQAREIALDKELSR